MTGRFVRVRLLADAAKAAGVQHFVYTSVVSADRNTGLPHFESKWQIEQHIAHSGLSLYDPAARLLHAELVQLHAGADPERDAAFALEPANAACSKSRWRTSARSPRWRSRTRPSGTGRTIELAGEELTMLRVAEP